MAHGLALPEYKTEGSMGMDLVVARDTYIPVGEFADIPHDITIGCPPGVYFQVLARSSLFKKGIIMPVGLIDSDYRGLIYSPVFNIGSQPIRIERGSRISQIIFFSAMGQVDWNEHINLDSMSKTKRGVKGFGSTG